MSKYKNDFKVVSPNWIVPDHVCALQTIRNCSSKSNSLETNKTEDSIGLKFLRSNKKGLNQLHSNASVQIPSENIVADSSYTYQKNTVCVVKTADCMPILVTNEEGSFVSAIHAGWRGLSSGIIENTVRNIKSLSNLIVWIGPHISQKYFEVGAEVKKIFLDNDSANAVAFDRGENKKYLLSLKIVAEIKFNKMGIKNIYCMDNFCTYANSDIFFSYRRGDINERMSSLVWMNK